jgi:hypothetical protein
VGARLLGWLAKAKNQATSRSHPILSSDLGEDCGIGFALALPGIPRKMTAIYN